MGPSLALVRQRRITACGRRWRKIICLLGQKAIVKIARLKSVTFRREVSSTVTDPQRKLVAADEWFAVLTDPADLSKTRTLRF